MIMITGPLEVRYDYVWRMSKQRTTLWSGKNKINAIDTNIIELLITSPYVFYEYQSGCS